MRRALWISVLVASIVVHAPAAAAPDAFDAQSDALGVLAFLDFGPGAPVPVDPKFPHAASQARRSGSLADSRGVAAFFDPGFLLAAPFACLPSCPPANPWESTVAATFWPQPPPQEEAVGLQGISNPSLAAEALTARSRSSQGPASTNEAFVANLRVGAPGQGVTVQALRSTSDTAVDGAAVVTTARSVLTGVEAPGPLRIETVTVEATIRTDGTPEGTTQEARVVLGAITAGTTRIEAPTANLASALEQANRSLAPAGVQLRAGLTCTGADCKGKAVYGFDIISGRSFCDVDGQLCALAVGLELEVRPPGQRYVLTLGRSWAQATAAAPAPAPQPTPRVPQVLALRLPATGGGAGAGLGVLAAGALGYLASRRRR